MVQNVKKNARNDQITGQGSRLGRRTDVSWRNAQLDIRAGAARRRPAHRDKQARETTTPATMMAECGSATRPWDELAVRLSWRAGPGVKCRVCMGRWPSRRSISPQDGEVGQRTVHGNARTRQRHVLAAPARCIIATVGERRRYWRWAAPVLTLVWLPA
jgi:hypothetical protein